MLRVLVVDDDEELATMLAMALRQRGYDVRIARTSDEALGAARELEPDLALLDLHLGREDGHALGLRLRALTEERVQLVAMTGDESWGAQGRSTEHGFVAHLVKPVALSDVARLLAVLDVGMPRRGAAR